MTEKFKQADTFRQSLEKDSVRVKDSIDKLLRHNENILVDRLSKLYAS